METDRLSGIIVYTIHDNDSLRDALKNGIVEKYKEEQLDESTYGIPIQGITRDKAVQELKDICLEACKKSNSNFKDHDIVCLYFPTYPEESGDNRYIRQVYIIAPKNQEK